MNRTVSQKTGFVKKLGKAALRAQHEATTQAIIRECVRISAKPMTLNELIDATEAKNDAQIEVRLKERGIVGYANTIPGDQRTDIVDVPAFTIEQQKTRAQIASLHAAIEQGVAASKLLSKIMEDCPHHVFADSEGFPYNNRDCLVCGSYMGTI